jgi:putative protein-disulfide isomerase
VSEADVLVDVAESIGLDRDAFSSQLVRTLGIPVQHHIAASRQLMERIGVSGFPAMAIEREGRFYPIDVGADLGRPATFRTRLLAASAHA